MLTTCGATFLIICRGSLLAAALLSAPQLLKLLSCHKNQNNWDWWRSPPCSFPVSLPWPCTTLVVAPGANWAAGAWYGAVEQRAQQKLCCRAPSSSGLPGGRALCSTKFWRLGKGCVMSCSPPSPAAAQPWDHVGTEGKWFLTRKVWWCGGKGVGGSSLQDVKG